MISLLIFFLLFLEYYRETFAIGWNYHQNISSNTEDIYTYIYIYIYIYIYGIEGKSSRAIVKLCGRMANRLSIKIKLVASK